MKNDVDVPLTKALNLNAPVECLPNKINLSENVCGYISTAPFQRFTKRVSGDQFVGVLGGCDFGR